MARRRIFQRLQKFILVWVGDENLQNGFNGDVFIIPPIDVVAEPGPHSPYRFPSAEDADGTPIPGTIVIQDRIETSERGGHTKLFDAAEACAFFEDSREDLFNRGFAICMDPKEVEAAKEEGRPKYEASQDDLAREILHSELERRKKWDLKGIPSPPSSSDGKIRWAAAHLEQRAKAVPQISDDSLKQALAGGLPDIPENIEQIAGPAPKPKEMLGSVPKAEAPTGLPATEVWQMADAAGINLTKAEMAKLLDGDDAFRAKLIGQIAAKQEGERATA